MERIIINKYKYILGIILLILSISCTLHYSIELDKTHADSESYTRYYYNQLTDMGKRFYTAIDTMVTDPTMLSTMGSFDLVSNNVVSQSDLDNYAKGSRYITESMYSARDAYTSDHPEIFYIDFSYLSIRITKDASNTYYASMGSGRSDSYLNGFIDASKIFPEINRLNTKINEIVAVANTKTTIKSKILYVHDYLTNNIKYTLEPDTTTVNVDTGVDIDAKPFVHSAYGALILKQSVCEGYSKAFKLIMDRLEIPCVVVQGLYSVSSTARESHMWNYVNIDNTWYAIDVTMDDPIGASSPNHDYLLKSANYMDRTHTPDGVMSESNYRFTYPTLTDGTDNIYSGILKVGCEYETTTDNQNVITTQYIIFSYDNLNYTTIKNMGLRIVVGNDGENGTYWSNLDFFIDNGYFEENNTEWKLINYNYTEIAVVEYNPNYFSNIGNDINEHIFLSEYENKFIERSSKIETPYIGHQYPYLTNASPIDYQTISVGTYHNVTLTFSENLKVSDTPTRASSNGLFTSTDGKVKIKVVGDSSINAGSNSDIKDIVWNESSPNTVSFKFSPSRMYGDDLCNYTISIESLVGQTSNNRPNIVHYFAVNKAVFDCPTSDGVNYKVYAKPVLLENKDLSTDGWMYADSTPVTEDISYRVALIASKIDDSITQDMLDKVENMEGNTGKEILSSASYNIDLTLCQKQISELPTGRPIKMLLPFPDGYGPEDDGVTFRAYHFDKQGNAEEITCIVNQYGLVILCNSFSPFTIVAMPKDTSDTVKEIYVHTTTGGTVNNNGIFTLPNSSTSSVAINLTSNPNYVIDSISINGTPISQGRGQSNYTLTLEYQNLKSDNVIEVKYIRSSVLSKEATLGRVAVIPTVTSPSASISGKDKYYVGDTITLQANTDGLGNLSFTWYKDGVEIPGEYNATLVIENSTLEHSGNYKVKIKNAVGQASLINTSENYNIEIKNKPNIILIVIIIISIIIIISAVIIIVLVLKNRNKKITQTLNTNTRKTPNKSKSTNTKKVSTKSTTRKSSSKK